MKKIIQIDDHNWIVQREEVLPLCGFCGLPESIYEPHYHEMNEFKELKRRVEDLERNLAELARSKR